MTGNHGKFYSYKIYIKYPCGDSETFLLELYTCSHKIVLKKNS